MQKTYFEKYNSEAQELFKESVRLLTSPPDSPSCEEHPLFP